MIYVMAARKVPDRFCFQEVVMYFCNNSGDALTM